MAGNGNLSFVSTAILSSSDGISHNEEREVESEEVKDIRARAASKPLFEQLRANREEEEERQNEAAKLLRGVKTLDEEDVAHLHSIEQQRMERDSAQLQAIEDEVAAFRAARAERLDNEGLRAEGDATESVLSPALGKTDSASSNSAKPPNEKKSLTLATPTFRPKIKAKKRKQPPSADRKTENVTIENEGTKHTEANGHHPKRPKEPQSSQEQREDQRAVSGGLGSLLGCYSDDDDDD